MAMFRQPDITAWQQVYFQRNMPPSSSTLPAIAVSGRVRAPMVAAIGGKLLGSLLELLESVVSRIAEAAMMHQHDSEERRS
jgi:hypothetical protein